MSVYIDPLMRCLPNAQWRWEKSCHMWADTVDELHAFAARVGLRREWFQDIRRPNGRRFPHYDLTPARRTVAVRLGAVELDRDESVAKWRELGFMRQREATA